MIAETVDDLIAPISDGASIAVPTSRSAPSMVATRALIKKQVRDLHIIAIPTSGMQTDMLVGAGCVALVESAGITMDEQGLAPCFVNAVKKGTVQLKDTTCPALISALQAGEKGIPFIPMRGLIGSDLLKHRPDYRTINNPFEDDNDPVVLLPAIRPDVALIHAPLADQYGNVWIGKARELMTMAHAAKTVLVTAEAITDDDLMLDPLRSPACIPAHYVTAVCEAPAGAWPLGLADAYDADEEELRRYTSMARTQEGFRAYLDTSEPRVAAAE